MRLNFQMKHHPVGQGGLATGEVQFGKGLLRWAYDCGSNQALSLQREVRRVSAGGNLDFLFLSHLDSDHVSGIDQLLTNTKVKEVVLPYLAEHELSACIAADLEAATLTGSFLEFAGDPAAWFAGRGVERITFVRSQSEDDEGSGPPVVPEGPSPEKDGSIEVKWSVPPEPMESRGDALVQAIDNRSTVWLLVNGQALNWVLAPFAHRPSDAKFKVFVDRLKIEFDSSHPRDVAARARTSDGREALRRCYDMLWSDHNLVSMSLYSGPATEVKNTHFAMYFGKHYHSYQSVRSPGWLNTGDAKLSGRRRRSALIKHFGHFTSFISVLQIPHHGAWQSFHEELLYAYPQLCEAIIASGPNPYGHPHAGVIDALKMNGIGYKQVDEYPGSSFGTRGVMQA